MGDDTQREFPMVVLMLDQVRRVTAKEARRVVQADLGDEAASSVRLVEENSAGMEHIDWRLGVMPYHLGTPPVPYINAVGAGKVDGENKLVGPLKRAMREKGIAGRACALQRVDFALRVALC